MTTQKLPTYFLSHGGGPWPFMMDQVGHLYGKLDASLRDIPRQIGVTPKAVLVITAHWEGRDFMLSSSAKPPMIYDYGGFPPHTYQVQYSAPGSPELARRLTRPQDRVMLNEKHPEDGVQLKENMAGDRRVKVHLGEGWHVARAMLPVQEKRAVMLIDPPFEQLDEMQRCAASMKEAIGRMRQTVAAIWYPVKDQRALRRFYQDLAGTGAPKLLRVELLVHPLDTPNSLNGSGLAIANPPWGLEEELRELLPWLSKKLGQTQGGWQMDWLIAES